VLRASDTGLSQNFAGIRLVAHECDAARHTQLGSIHVDVGDLLRCTPCPARKSLVGATKQNLQFKVPSRPAGREGLGTSGESIQTSATIGLNPDRHHEHAFRLLPYRPKRIEMNEKNKLIRSAQHGAAK
jgi:hypothetical protein